MGELGAGEELLVMVSGGVGRALLLILVQFGAGEECLFIEIVHQEHVTTAFYKSK